MRSLNRLPLAPVAIAVAMACTSTGVWAQSQSETQLKQITVKGQREATPSTTETKTAETVQKEMIRDTRDLVRYSPDVGIAENGMRMKGFAMRGVDGNRVGISIDGVALPDFEENSLYQRYGNFNNSRLTIDPELVTGIDVVKGSDSFNMGSGSLGGGVNYRSLRARDIVEPGQKTGYLLRTGYASKNREWVNTVGAGFVGEQLDMVALYSQRYGHQMKAEGTRGAEFIVDRWSGLVESDNENIRPDPARVRTHSGLFKVGYQINDAHRIGFSLNGQRVSNFVDQKSYSLSVSQREVDNQGKRLNANIHHIYTPENSSWLSSVETELDIQKTDLAAVTYDKNYPWRSTTLQLDEIKDRRSENDFKRLQVQLETLPQNLWGGQHTFGLKVFYSVRDFSTINYDHLNIARNARNNKAPDLVVETIQYPMKTTSFGLALKDNVVWSKGFSTSFGLRYDYDKVAAQELNAKCSKACTAEGKPGGNSFSVWNAFVGLNKAINDNWMTSYQLSTGHRVPTASEMYFTFTHPAGNWKSNRNLKAERSVNHTFSLIGQSEVGRLEANIFRTNYRKFLHESVSVSREELMTEAEHRACLRTAWFPEMCKRFDERAVMQMVNLNKASITGFELKGHVNLDQISNLSRGWSANMALGYSKGKLSSGESLLSIQPLKVVLGLDYQDPNETFGVFSRVTYTGEKKEKDTKVLNQRFINRTRTFEQTMQTYTYRNKAAFVFDVYGYWKPSKNLTLRAGLYNVFDRKYYTWDAMRSLDPFVPATTNTINFRNGKGLERYAAPGRNLSLSAEYKF